MTGPKQCFAPYRTYEGKAYVRGRAGRRGGDLRTEAQAGNAARNPGLFRMRRPVETRLTP